MTTRPPPAYPLHGIPLREIQQPSTISVDDTQHPKKSKRTIMEVSGAIVMVLIALLSIACGGWIISLAVKLGSSPEIHEAGGWFLMMLWAFLSLFFIAFGVLLIFGTSVAMITGEGVAEWCSGGKDRNGAGNVPV
ncbi:hypothetical protein N7513_008319 [Penicillium frequentans]|nr:hypothetical protein N7513_008319 [Penicillium glabrum]